MMASAMATTEAALAEQSLQQGKQLFHLLQVAGPLSVANPTVLASVETAVAGLWSAVGWAEIATGIFCLLNCCEAESKAERESVHHCLRVSGAGFLRPDVLILLSDPNEICTLGGGCFQVVNGR